MNRFKEFSPMEKQLLMYGMRNCSMYDYCGEHPEEEVVKNLMEELAGAQIFHERASTN